MATAEIDFTPVQPGTSEGTLYTPSAGYGVITQIIMSNTTALPATVTIGKGGVAAANQIVPGITIPANTVETLDLAGFRVANGVNIRALQGTGSAITVAICGYEVT